mgnify:CR=1 FL=1
MLARSSRSLLFASRVVLPARESVSRPILSRSFSSSSARYCSANLQQLKEKLESLKSDEAMWKEKCENIQADKQGILQREAREIEDAKHYGITSFAKSLLNINDNLGLALKNTDLQSSEPKEQLEILVEGIKMTHVEAADIMQKQNIAPFQPTVGDRFDHDEHNAVKTVTEESNENSATITKVVKHGYKLKHKVLRPADVEVHAKVIPKPKPTPKPKETTKKDETKEQQQKNTEEKAESDSASDSSSGSDNEKAKDSESNTGNQSK